MSWNPNQPPSGSNPYQPQQTGGSNPYQPQQTGGSNPYQPQQQPGGPPPYQPQQQPMQNPYVPQPGQNPYEQPSGMGAFGSQPGYNPSYGYAPATPLPLGQAIQGLPNQYIKILTKPGAQSFAEEQGKAEWGIIWIQLLFVGLIGTIIGLIETALTAAAVSSTFGGGVGSAYATLSSFLIGSSSVYSIIAVVIGFFIVVGVQYLLAKAFQGTGDFKQQAYNYTLFYTPLAVVSNVIGWIPFLGPLVGFAIGIYQLVLNVFSIMAAHRMSGGKATAVVLIPIAAIILLVVLCFVAIFALFLHAASSAYPSY